MNTKVYRNQAKLMNASNRKKLYKKGKQWIVASSLFLSLLAGGSLLGVHADNVQPQAKATVQKNNLDKNKVDANNKQNIQVQNRVLASTNNIQAQQRVSTQANNLHKQLLNNSHNTYQQGLSKVANVNNQSHQQLHRQFNLTTNNNHPENKLTVNDSKPVNDLEGIAFVGSKFESNNNRLDITSDVVGRPFSETVQSGVGISSKQLASLVPSGYELAPSSASAFVNNKSIGNVGSLESVKYQNFSDGLDDAQDGEHLIPVLPTTKDHVNVKANPVDIEGAVYLHIPNHAQITLPYSIQTNTNVPKINILEYTNPSVLNPSDYIDAKSLRFFFDDSMLQSDKGYSYSGARLGNSVSTANSSTYNFTLNPADFDSYQNGTKLIHKDVNLYFNPTNKVTEKVNYVYHNNTITSDVEQDPQDSTEDASKTVTPATSIRLNKLGYYIPSNSMFKFSYNGSVDVPVLPKPAHVNIVFVNVLNNNQLNSNNPAIYKGNDYRATDATRLNMPVKHITTNDIPAGYHIVSNVSNVNKVNNQSVLGLNDTINFNNDDNQDSSTPTYVAVEPNVATDNIIYENSNGNILGEFKPSGSTATSNLAINSSTANKDSLPNGYVLSNGESKSFSYDGCTYVVPLSGSSVKDNYTINIVADGSKLSSYTRRGTLTSVGDSITVNPANYAPATNYLPTNSDQLTTVYVNSDGHLVNTGKSNLLGATGNTITLNYKELKGINGKNGTNGRNGAKGATGPTGATGATGATGKNGANGQNGQNGSFSLPNIITVNYKNQLGQVVKTGYVTNASGVTSDLISDVTIPSDYQISSQTVSDYDQMTNTSKQLSTENNNTQLSFTADKDPHEITIHVSGMTGSQISSNESASTSSSESSATNSANIVINGLNSAVVSASKALSSEAKKAEENNSAAINSNDSKYQSLSNELNSLQSAQASNSTSTSSVSNALNSQAKRDSNNSSSENNDHTYQSLVNELNALKNSEASNNTSTANINAKLSSEINNSSAYKSLSNELSSLQSAQAANSSSTSSVNNALNSQAKHDDNNYASESNDNTYTSLSNELKSLENAQSSNASSASSANSKMSSYAGDNTPAYQSLSSVLNSLKVAQSSNSNAITSTSNALNSQAGHDKNNPTSESNDNSYTSLSNTLRSLENAKNSDNNAVSSANSAMSSEQNNNSEYQSLSNELKSLQSAQSSNNTSASSVSNALNNEAKHDNNNPTSESNDGSYTSLSNELKSLKAAQSSNTIAASSADSKMDSVTGNNTSNDSVYQSLSNELSSLRAAQLSNDTSASSVSNALNSEAKHDDNNSALESNDDSYTSLSNELKSLESAKSSNNSATSSANSVMNSVENEQDPAYQSLANALSSLENRFGYNNSTIASANSVSASASETIHGLESAAKSARSIATSAESKAKHDSGSAKSADDSTASSANGTDTIDINLINKLNSIIASASTEASSDASNMDSASKSVATDSKAVANDESKAKNDNGNSAAESNDQKILSSANSILASEKAVSGSASSDDSYAKSVIDSANNLINGASNAFNSLASQYASASNAKNQSEMNKFSSEMKSAENAINAANAAAANASNIASSAENALSGLTSASVSASNAAKSANAAVTSANSAFNSAKNASAHDNNPASKSSVESAYASASRAQSSAASAASSANNAVSSANSASNSEASASNADATSTKASQQNSKLAANDSSADSASTSASSALSSAEFASTSASNALSSANSASSEASHDNNTSEKASASTAVSNAKSASTSASEAVNSAASNSTSTSNTASVADSLAANNVVNFDPYTYITIIEQENGQPVKSYAKLIKRDSTQMGGTFIIKPSDTDIEPAGFTPDNSNQNIIGTMTAKGISLLPGTDTFVYDADDAKVDEAAQTGNSNDKNIIPIYNQSNDNIPAKSQMDSNTNKLVQIISGAKNQKLSNTQAPEGYQFDPKYEYHFNDKGQLVGIAFDKNGNPLTNQNGTTRFVTVNKDNPLHVLGTSVHGKANITLKYIVKNANGDIVVHKADDAQIILSGRVGDHITINPWKYFKDNFNVPKDQTITIEPNAVSAQYDYGQQYTPNLEFDYYANQAAPIEVQYDNNGTPIMNSKSPQIISNIKGVAGDTVYLGSASDTSDDEPNHYNVLNIPDGYYLPGNSVRVVLKPADVEIVNGHKQSKPLIMTVDLHMGHVNEQQAIDTINFNGDPIANTDEIGSLGETGSIEAPVGYHFINNENGTFTFSNQTHTFDVEPNDPTNTNNNVVNYNLPRGTSMNSFINTLRGTNTGSNNKSTNSDTPDSNGQNIVNNIHTPKANSNETITKIAKHLKKGQSIVVNTNSGKLTINSKRTNDHYRWLYVIKPILLHKNIDAVGSGHDTLRRIKPRHKFYARIINMYKLVGNGRNFIRYEISVKIGKYYRHVFVTGNSKFVRNAYYQLTNLHHAKKYHHKYYKARIIAPTFEYKGRLYARRARQHLMKVGKTVHISRIVRIGRKGDKQTKFELTNGRYITANKNYIKLI